MLLLNAIAVWCKDDLLSRRCVQNVWLIDWLMIDWLMIDWLMIDWLIIIIIIILILLLLLICKCVNLVYWFNCGYDLGPIMSLLWPWVKQATSDQGVWLWWFDTTEELPDKHNMRYRTCKHTPIPPDVSAPATCSPCNSVHVYALLRLVDLRTSTPI